MFNLSNKHLKCDQMPEDDGIGNSASSNHTTEAITDHTLFKTAITINKQKIAKLKQSLELFSLKERFYSQRKQYKQLKQQINILNQQVVELNKGIALLKGRSYVESIINDYKKFADSHYSASNLYLYICSQQQEHIKIANRQIQNIKTLVRIHKLATDIYVSEL